MPFQPHPASHVAQALPTHWPPLPHALQGVTVTPDDVDYRSVRSSYMKVGSPHAVVMAEHEDEVAAAVQWAAGVRHETGQRIPVSIRSGGHGISGSSTNQSGIIVDLSSFDHVEVLDPTSGLLRAGAGARWGDVAAALAPHDLALTSGNFGDTGVGGLATAGGLGYFVRSQGLTLDHVRRVRLLTADGIVRWVDAEHEPELFWAVRGGGSQAGIALDFEFEAPRLNSEQGGAHIIYQEIQYLVEDLPRFTREWGEWMTQSPREAVSFLMLQRAGNGRFVAAGKTVWANDDATAATPTLRAAQGLARVMSDAAYSLEYGQIVPTPRSPHVGQQRVVMRDVLVDRADEAVGQGLASALEDPATLVAELRPLGGAVADVGPDETAWAGRHQEALVAIWANPEPDPVVDRAFAGLQSLGTGSYGAYSSDTRLSAAQLAWPGRTGERLQAVAAHADPEGLFDGGLTLRG